MRIKFVSAARIQMQASTGSPSRILLADPCEKCDPIKIMPDSFEDFVHAHYQSAYRFAYSLCCEYADAWDLTHQSFAIVQTRLGQLRDPTKGRQWLFTIVHREFLRMRRRENMRNEHALEATALEDSLILEDHAARIDAQTMLLSFGKMEEHFRVPLSLFYFEQLSYKEIAEVLDIPIGTVMSRLARAKGILRNLLKSAPPDAATQLRVVPDADKEVKRG